VPNVRLTLAYDGTGFRGWARQRDDRLRTIEGELVGVLTLLLQEEVRLSVAGRTDAGVHARGQVVSFSTHSERAPERLLAAVNRRLAPEVVVTAAAHVAHSFDARRSATGREYRYRVDSGRVPDPFTARFVWHRPGGLSIRRMRAAAASLEGEHDFASFCRRPGEDRSTVRRLERISVVRHGDRIELGFRANAFLHQMVRSLVGTLVAAGEERIAPEAVAGILRARSRAAAGPVAPARGLTLERVLYGRHREL
jgi:tRNA pseudouridine38-40 synthase